MQFRLNFFCSGAKSKIPLGKNCFDPDTFRMTNGKKQGSFCQSLQITHLGEKPFYFQDKKTSERCKNATHLALEENTTLILPFFTTLQSGKFFFKVNQYFLKTQ